MQESYFKTLGVEKAGVASGDYEDAFKESLAVGRWAVADGATEASFAKLWADILVKGYVDGYQGDSPSLDNAQRWLAPLQKAWRDQVNSRLQESSTAWYVAEKAEQGTGATFLGLSLRTDHQLGRYHAYEALAVGDSCLLHLRNGHLLSSFPIQDPSAFGTTPSLLGASQSETATSRQPLWRAKKGRWLPGDEFLLMTDAAAEWFLREYQAGRSPLRRLIELIEAGNEEFRDYLAGIRNQKHGIKNDDTTVMYIVAGQETPVRPLVPRPTLWPGRADYDNAVLQPTAFSNDEMLRECQVVRAGDGRPELTLGHFSNVYRVQDTRGEGWAVKCFLRHVPDRGERYEKIIAATTQPRILCLPSVRYYREHSIRVGDRFFPTFRTEWLSGIPLNRYVEEHLKDPQALEAITLEWLKIVRELRQKGLAHGDLQPHNVLVVRGALCLVDLDGMYVPGLEGRKALDPGHPNYRHPRRGQDFGPDMDLFPMLVVYVALRALTYEPQLWGILNTGDNMLFRHADFVNPRGARAFQVLEKCPNTEICSLGQKLAQWSQGNLSDTPNLEPILSAETLTPMERASDETGTSWLGLDEGGGTPKATPEPTRPRIVVQTPNVDIGQVSVGDKQIGYVWWANAGGGQLKGDAFIDAPDPWLAFEDGSTVWEFKQNSVSCPVLVDGGHMEAGKKYSAELIIRSNGGIEVVKVSAKGQSPSQAAGGAPGTTGAEQAAPSVPAAEPSTVPVEAEALPPSLPLKAYLGIAAAIVLILLALVAVAGAKKKAKQAAEEQVKSALREAEGLLAKGQDNEAVAAYRRALDRIQAFGNKYGLSDLRREESEANDGIKLAETRQRVAEDLATAERLLREKDDKHAAEICRQALTAMKPYQESAFVDYIKRARRVTTFVENSVRLRDLFAEAGKFRNDGQCGKAKDAYETVAASAKAAYEVRPDEALKLMMEGAQAALAAPDMQGYVKYQGKWITPAQKEEYEKKGYTIYKDQFRSPEDIARLEAKGKAEREGREIAAKAAFDSARRGFESGRWEEAAKEFSSLKTRYGDTTSYKERETEVARSLDVVERLSKAMKECDGGKHDEALKIIEQCRRQFASASAKDMIGRALDHASDVVLQSRQEHLRKGGAEVRLRIALLGAKDREDSGDALAAKIDGIPMSVSGLEASGRVLPGPNRKIEVTKKGYASLIQTVEVTEAGVDGRVRLAPIRSRRFAVFADGRQQEVTELGTDGQIKARDDKGIARPLRKDDYIELQTKEVSEGESAWDVFPLDIPKALQIAADRKLILPLRGTTLADHVREFSRLWDEAGRELAQAKDREDVSRLEKKREALQWQAIQLARGAKKDIDEAKKEYREQASGKAEKASVERSAHILKRELLMSLVVEAVPDAFRGEFRSLLVSLPPVLEKMFTAPSLDATHDSHGKPIVTRGSSRFHPLDGWAYEIWLEDPRMEFVLLWPGEFTMGPSQRKEDQPHRTQFVRIPKPFYIGKYEVTYGQWELVMSKSRVAQTEGRHPVISKTWTEATDFARRIGGRLPTEAEWEYACRVGRNTPYCYGQDPQKLEQYAWYGKNSDHKNHPVGEKTPNDWGIYDMHGNVWEWCQNILNETPTGKTLRVFRGGCYQSPPDECRGTFRDARPPETRLDVVGFRCVIGVP